MRINFKKGVWNCFVCGGVTIEQLLDCCLNWIPKEEHPAFTRWRGWE